MVEYHPQPWNQWQEIGNLQVTRREHAALSIGPKQLSCVSGGSFNRYDDDCDPSDDQVLILILLSRNNTTHLYESL